MANKKIWVVDDDPVVRILIDEFLSNRGYAVEAVESGGECLQRLGKEVPDILLLDLMMPEISGIEVLKEIRSDPRTAKIPVVMMSSDTETESLAQTNNVSANSYVQRPFGMKDLLQAVENIGPDEVKPRSD